MSEQAVQLTLDFAIQEIRTQLFKVNNIVSYCLVKISIVNMTNTPVFFVEKMLEAFALQKLLLYFQQKISMYLVIKS